MSTSRRKFLQMSAISGLSLLTSNIFMPLVANATQNKSTVYFTSEISPKSILKLYLKVNQGIQGKVAIKIHTGEPNGPNIISPAWVQKIQAAIPQSTLVECNVLYESPRKTTKGHRETLKINGWTFSEVDIMDEDGDVSLPVRGGKHLKELAVGKHLLNYDSMLVLTHFKGHTMGGFGGSLKNLAIGCASGQVGKNQMHTLGPNGEWPGGIPFHERMVEGGKAIIDHFGSKITYINVMNKMSVSCDCEGTNAKPVQTPDIGVLASTDVLALDQASVDLIYALPENERKHLVERIESRQGLHQLDYMEKLKMGNRQYELVKV